MGIARKPVSVVPTTGRTRRAVDTIPPGTLFGRYQLIRRLAVGGMAELYLARATGIEGFEKLVALKRILPQHAEQDDFVSMFLDEARLTAAVHHANVAQVYDIGRCDDGLFFTMEYIHGEDVRSIMQACARKQRGLPLEHSLSIAIGAAAGLHAAHEQTIVHRDVSPSNLLVSYDGCLKLIDFGIAKAITRQTQTRAGTLKGKIAYMSPEQCLGEPLDRRSDVFALGVVLYELTTGARLFPVDNEYTAMRQIVDCDAPPPSRRKPGYPPELEAIVMRALRRDRTERYGSAEELQLALEGFVRARGLAVSSAQLGYFMRGLFPDRAARREDRSTGLTPPRVLPLPAPGGTRLRVAPSAAVLEPLAFHESGPAANDELALPLGAPLAISTGMFDTPTPELLEPSISISADVDIDLDDEPAPPRRRRWQLPLTLAITASISAVIAAVVVMSAQPSRETSPSRSTVAEPVAVPVAVPVAEPDAVAAPVAVAEPEPIVLTLSESKGRAPSQSAAWESKDSPKSKKHVAKKRSKPPKLSPAAKAKAKSRWDADSALPPM